MVSHIHRSALTGALAVLAAVTSLGAQARPTISNPRPGPVMTPPAIATPATPALATPFLHSGTYQLRLQAPSPSTGAQVTTVTDVHVVVIGQTVHLTTGSSTETLDGTLSGSQVQIHGVAGGAKVTMTGSSTPSGVAGTIALQDSTRTVRGTFALTVVHTAQLSNNGQSGSSGRPGWKEFWREWLCRLFLIC